MIITLHDEVCNQRGARAVAQQKLLRTRRVKPMSAGKGVGPQAKFLVGCRKIAATTNGEVLGCRDAAATNQRQYTVGDLRGEGAEGGPLAADERKYRAVGMR
jgi:hypothetical protein